MCCRCILSLASRYRGSYVAIEGCIWGMDGMITILQVSLRVFIIAVSTSHTCSTEMHTYRYLCLVCMYVCVCMCVCVCHSLVMQGFIMTFPGLLLKARAKRKVLCMISITRLRMSAYLSFNLLDC